MMRVRLGTLGLLTLVSVIAVLAAAWSGAIEAPLPGLSDPGVITRWGLPAARGVHDAAAALTVGLLVLAAVVLPAETQGVPGRLEGVRARALRWATAAGSVWVLAGAAGLVLTYANLAGTNPMAPGTGTQVLYFITDFDLGRSLAASVLLAAVVTLGSAAATRVTTAGILAVVSLVALLPLALVGHAAGSANHAAAVDMLAAHLVGVTVWVGGLVGLVVLHTTLGDRLAVSATRYSTLAGWCFALVAASGVISAVIRVEDWSGLLTPYGALLAGKTAVLIALGVAGWWHRRRTLTALGAHTASTPARRGFIRLAVAEVGLMALALGLAVALTRTSQTDPLAAVEPESTAVALLGYEMPPPLTPLGWVLEWRLDPLWVPVALLAAGWYLNAVWRLRRRGDRWPLPRTLAWIGGNLVLIWATSSGPGVYGDILFSMHMVQHMTIAMAVPILLVLGAPITLALRTQPKRRDGSRGPREWLLLLVHSRLLRVLGHPVVAPVLFVGSLIVFYYSPLFVLSMSTHTGHVLMTTHFLLSGYVFAWMICGLDPGPPRPPYPFRLVLLIATMGFHAFFGVSMMVGTEIIGEEWFAAIPREWGPTLAEEQTKGGALAWGLGDYPVGLLTLAMSWAWISSDQRESRRYDRKADRDGDAELAAYNAHLQRLAERTQRHEASLNTSRRGASVPTPEQRR